MSMLIFGQTSHLSILNKGPYINDVSSKGEGGGRKIGKMGRHRLWMAPYLVSIFYNIFLTVAMAVVEND